ncbi:MAG: 50S ribosomal protein L14 [Parcubacteria group bacterium]|nr:50S ribosomal protein L14 [Parcubacteria group bacterium]
MIQKETILNVADNSGAKLVKCFSLPGGTRKHYARIGEVIIASVKKAEPRRETKNHEIVRAVVVRQRQNFRRKDGSYIKFDDNACCILDENNVPRGNRVTGPVPRELKEKGFEKIVTLAKDVV